MGSPIYEKSEEMIEIVKDILKERNDLFPYIYPEMIQCGVRVDKIAPANQKKILQIKGVRGPLSLMTDVKYVIYGYDSMWSSLSREKKVVYVANMLKRIKFPTETELKELAEKGEDFEWGKLESPDMMDFKSFIKALGIDWDENSTEVPDILDKSIRF